MIDASEVKRLVEADQGEDAWWVPVMADAKAGMAVEELIKKYDLVPFEWSEHKYFPRRLSSQYKVSFPEIFEDPELEGASLPTDLVFIDIYDGKVEGPLSYYENNGGEWLFNYAD